MARSAGRESGARGAALSRLHPLAPLAFKESPPSGGDVKRPDLNGATSNVCCVPAYTCVDSVRLVRPPEPAGSVASAGWPD
jgi:hypothetical protein